MDHVSQVFAGGLITAVQQLEAKDAELAKLRADLAAAKADAERYRWLRDASYLDHFTGSEYDDDIVPAAAVDAAIDAAIAGSKG